MDSLTQIVLGAAVGEAVLGKKVGNKAVFYGAIAGTIPDLDTLASHFTDTVTAIEFHRGVTHSLLFAVLTAPVFGYLIKKIEFKSSATWKNWSWLMFWGLITHPLLDSFTTWGTQLFWPLDYEIAIKSIFVIDPLYTVPFAVFLVLAMRQKRSSLKRKRYNRLGLIISTFYLVLGLIFKGIAYQNFVESLKLQQIEFDRIEIRPSPFNILLWYANVEVEDGYLLGDFSLFDDKMTHFEAVPKNHELLRPIEDNEKVQRLIEISNGWYSITKSDGTLYFNDLRFGKLDPSLEGSRFVFSYKLLPQEQGIIVEEVQKRPDDAPKILNNLIKRIGGN